jgi:hypothetical protein
MLKEINKMKDQQMKTGRAYTYLDHEAEESALIELMNTNRRRANFPETIAFTILDDKRSDKYDHKPAKLPQEIADAAKITRVYGNAPISRAANVVNLEPVEANSLRYVIMVEAPEITSSELCGPIGQGKANQLAAGVLTEVLSGICQKECLEGQRKYLRAATFYQRLGKRAERYS